MWSVEMEMKFVDDERCFLLLLDIVRQVISEGDRCVVTENCVDNAYCRDEKCQCVDGFMARNGACCM